MAMYLYSGDCRLGTAGQKTPFTDIADKPLFVGDIVVIYCDGEIVGGLTAVVNNEFTSYSDGTHVVKDGPVEPFVMGIKSVDLASPNQWSVVKVKDHRDVVDGERWPAYGFSYKSEWEPMKAWPVDFAGFTTANEIIDRIRQLKPQVWQGHEDLCWASWEIERLNAMLYGQPVADDL